MISGLLVYRDFKLTSSPTGLGKYCAGVGKLYSYLVMDTKRHHRHPISVCSVASIIIQWSRMQ